MIRHCNLSSAVSAILDKCSNLNHLKQLQSHLITLGHAHTHFYAFKLLRFCTLRLRDLAYARHLFEKFPSPNIYLYTALIFAYSSASDHHSAALLYRRMLRHNRSRPNHYMLSIVLKSLPEISSSFGVQIVQAQIAKLGYSGYPVVQMAMMDAYTRFGVDIGVARKLFDEMPERNVVAWTAMISGYMRAGRVGSAILLFEEMPEGIRDVPVWNCIVAGCVQNGLFPEAIEFFKRMVVEEGAGAGAGANRPNQGTVVCVLSALGHAGMLELGRCIHGYIYRTGLSLDSFVSNGLIDMYGKCGSLERSRIVFENSGGKDLISWNMLINCYALHGRSHEAVALFRDMVGIIKPDAVTFVGLLNACAHGGLVVEGHGYFNAMARDFGVEPQIEHYGCLIDLLARAGELEEAMRVVNGMRIPPDEAIWGSLLNGCKIHRRADLAELAVKRLVEINPRNGGCGAVLANMYGEIGRWEAAEKVRRDLGEGNGYKAKGCSWVEVGKQVHGFHSVDRSHPSTQQIYAVLECLVGACKMQHDSCHL